MKRRTSILKSGFTIIELLIVIVIIGILATIVLVSYNGIQGSARDKSVLSDLDTLDGIETDYGTKNNVAGLAWYSGPSGTNGAPDPSLNFTPSPGDIIDVVVNTKDYCMRSYNPNSSTYKTLATAAIKESTAGACATLPASSGAIADSTPPTSGLTVTTLAGSSTAGYLDGTGTSAEFNNPSAVAVGSSGNIYIADTVNNRIREITSAGVVSTLAGNGTAGYVDGSGTSAEFNYPFGVTVDTSGNVYVADSSNNLIREITSAGVVSTLAGNGTAGYVDSSGTSAEFNYPEGVAVDTSGNVYVADNYNNVIRKVTSAGLVSTLAGAGPSAGFNYPYGVAVDTSGTVYVADSSNNRIREIK